MRNKVTNLFLVSDFVTLGEKTFEGNTANTRSSNDDLNSERVKINTLV